MGAPSGQYRQRGSGRWPYILAAIAVIGIFNGLILATRLLGPASIPIWVVALGTVAAIGLGPIGKAFAARLHPSNDSLGEAVVPPELYEELDDLRGRIAELEERQDFSERLLSKRSDSDDKSGAH